MRTYTEAKEELHRSLDRLKVDSVDLWQMHNLINLEQKDKALNPGGAIDAFIEANEMGLIKFMGITGHGLAAPSRHFDSLQLYNFDSVLLPYNYILMQNKNYAADFIKLEEFCVKNKIAIQTIKSLAKGVLKEKESKYSVWYTPLENDESINNAVHWVLGNHNVFLNTTGDVNLLPKVLEAATRFDTRPNDILMNSDIKKYGIESLFKGEEI
jgi:predicted aldo/keto reductase-like oxidoreductase